jgi:hypothetical protein
MADGRVMHRLSVPDREVILPVAGTHPLRSSFRDSVGGGELPPFTLF